jgi:hypothetical protein
MDNTRYTEEDFGDFIQDLLNNHHFNDAKEEGIAKLVIDKGYEALSVNKKLFLKNQ